ncbi:MAG: HAD family hydrolase [bacterium]
MVKAVFIDRDGTLIKEAEYASSLKEIKVFQKSFKAVKLLKAAGYKVIIITNQSGVARGYFPETFVKKAHTFITEQFAEKGIKLDAFYYCPHYKDSKIAKYKKVCDCRKPKPGMVLKAKKRFNLDLSASFSMGDKLSDVKLGKNTGMHTILVQTGYGKKEIKKIDKASQPDFVAKDIAEAVKWILGREGKI